MTDWREGQEAVYLFAPDVTYRRKPKTIVVPVVITSVLPTQVHARHISRNRELKFIPKAKLRPKGYNLVNETTPPPSQKAPR